MFESKFLVTLIGLIVAVAAVNHIQASNEEKTKEHFLGNLPSMKWKIDTVAVEGGREGLKKGDFFSVPGTYQAPIAPRMFGGDYGANITYNLPSRKNLAVPTNPLLFSSIAEGGEVGAGDRMPDGINYYGETFQLPQTNEGFCTSCGDGGNPPSCNKGGIPETYRGGAPVAPANYAAGNYNEMLNKAYSGNNALPVTQSMLPVADMTSLAASNAAADGAPVVYDRYVYANRNSRLRSQGDPIRGDLPIVPCSADWFRPSVQPNVDLQQGAINVIAGTTNSTANSLANLIYTSSGNAETAIGGTNMSQPELKYANDVAHGLNAVNMANQIYGGASANQHDVMLSAFP